MDEKKKWSECLFFRLNDKFQFILMKLAFPIMIGIRQMHKQIIHAFIASYEFRSTINQLQFTLDGKNRLLCIFN